MRPAMPFAQITSNPRMATSATSHSPCCIAACNGEAMFKKKAGTKPKAKTTAKPDASAKPAGKRADAGGEIKVRMYKQGLGDCFLIGFPPDGGKTFYLMTDCRLLLCPPNAVRK